MFLEILRKGKKELKEELEEIEKLEEDGDLSPNVLCRRSYIQVEILNMNVEEES